MANPKGRTSNNPKRRFVSCDSMTEIELRDLAKRVIYVGSAHHKLVPGDYGFHPASNPRPDKSMCDGQRKILHSEAKKLMIAGLRAFMFSAIGSAGIPKYIWAVSKRGEVFEAKTNPLHEVSYHGYPLLDEDDMKKVILEEWNTRCPKR